MRNKKRVQRKINSNQPLNVAFIIQYIPGWNKLEPIYTRMLNDKRFNPIIVCVPLNIENNEIINGDNINSIYDYFVEHGYDAINALKDNGDWFDLKELELDYLFHSRPYNHFMPKIYSSGNIRKYALICNVLYGINTSQNAQKVTINKNYFRDVYCYFAFDELEKKLFEQKYRTGIKCGIQRCLPYGAVSLEQILKSRKERTNSEFEKRVIWTPRWSTDPVVGGSNFFKYKDVIKKLVADNPEILFTIRPHPLMFDNFLKTGEMTEIDVKEFKEYCSKTPNVSLDEQKEYSDTFWESDILITDNSGVVPEYFVTLKPIIYCHSDIFVYTSGFDKVVESSYQAYNAEDIEKYFNQLTTKEDIMKEKRLETIQYLYRNVNDISANIIEALADLHF